VATDQPSVKTMQDLTVGECVDLLGQHSLGRLAFVGKVGVMPLIIPVNYVIDRDTPVFRSDPGSKLTAAILGAPVAFEVDGGFDELKEIGWSVVVHGHAEEVTDPAEVARLEQLPLAPWAPGAKAHYVRVSPGQITGRRISSTEVELSDLPGHWLGQLAPESGTGVRHPAFGPRATARAAGVTCVRIDRSRWTGATRVWPGSTASPVRASSRGPGGS